MGLFLANPWGLLALLGLPAILIIHLLRRKSRRLTVSTLFLIERALPSSEGGRRLRRLQNSLPLWIQLLAVCALAWLLSQPRWIDARSSQTVVVVLDDSASMSAFREAALTTASQKLASYLSAAAETRWIFLRSDASRLGAGSSLDAALNEVSENWHPERGVHDPAEAFRLARTLAGPGGAVVFLTDHVPDAASVSGIHWMACGEKLENAGFLGASVEGARWKALLKNFGALRRDIRWRVAGEGWKTTPLEPSASTEISGAFPPGKNAVMLELDADPFSFDDRIPVLLPQPKVLNIASVEDEKHAVLFEQLQEVATPFTPATPADADVVFSVFNPLSPGLPDRAAVVFLTDSGSSLKQIEGLLVAENHPLMQNLNWQGLMAGESLRIPAREGDQALLWKGGRPLIFLRAAEKGPQLVFNFDLLRSNAARLPAFVLLVDRYLNDVRSRKEAYEAKNADTLQSLTVAGAGTSETPAKPDFFQIKAASGEVLLDGAAQFADLREADFKDAVISEGNPGTLESTRLKNVQGESLDPLWTVLLAGFLIWNWWLTGTPRRAAVPIR